MTICGSSRRGLPALFVRVVEQTPLNDSRHARVTVVLASETSRFAAAAAAFHRARSSSPSDFQRAPRIFIFSVAFMSSGSVARASEQNKMYAEGGRFAFSFAFAFVFVFLPSDVIVSFEAATEAASAAFVSAACDSNRARSATSSDFHPSPSSFACLGAVRPSGRDPRVSAQYSMYAEGARFGFASFAAHFDPRPFPFPEDVGVSLDGASFSGESASVAFFPRRHPRLSPAGLARFLANASSANSKVTGPYSARSSASLAVSFASATASTLAFESSDASAVSAASTIPASQSSSAASSTKSPSRVTNSSPASRHARLSSSSA